MFRFEVINNFEDFLRLEGQWNSLLVESDQDEALMTHEFFCSWWETFGKDHEMLVVLVWENEELIAIAPLMRRKVKWRGAKAEVISCMANIQSNRTGLIIKGNRKNILSETLRFFKASEVYFDMFQLNYILKGSWTEINIIDTLQTCGYKYREMPHNFSPFISIKLDWQEYKKDRSRNFRHKLNRLNNLYRRLEDFNVIKYSNDKIEDAINEVFSISEKSWQYDKDSFLVSTKKEQHFLYNLAIKMAEKGYLNIWVLKIREIPVAFVFNLTYKKRIYSLKIGYDQAYSKFSPGEFLISKAIQDSFDNGYHEYDWLGTNLPFKMRWADHCHEHCNYWIFNKTARGKLLATIEILIISNLSRIKVLRNLYKKIAQTVHSE